MLLPAATPFGEAELVTTKSATAVVPTTVEAEAVLLLEFGSLTEELAVTVSVFTFVTRAKVAAVLPAIFKAVQTTLPAAPTGGVVQLQPTGAATETKVEFVGTASTNVALSAALGPLFVTTCV